MNIRCFSSDTTYYTKHKPCYFIYLEGKLGNTENEVAELNKTKREVMMDLQESRIREKNFINDIGVLEKEKAEVLKQNQGLINKAKATENEKMDLSRELNSKMSLEMQSAEAILGELKSLERSLNAVRKEKSLVEDKYNTLKFENERLQRTLDLSKEKRNQTSTALFSRSVDQRRVISRALDTPSIVDSQPDSDIESMESYAGFPDSARAGLDFSFSMKSPVPDVFVFRSNETTPVADRNVPARTPVNNHVESNRFKAGDRDSKNSQSYSVEDTRYVAVLIFPIFINVLFQLHES